MIMDPLLNGFIILDGLSQIFLLHPKYIWQCHSYRIV